MLRFRTSPTVEVMKLVMSERECIAKAEVTYDTGTLLIPLMRPQVR